MAKNPSGGQDSESTARKRVNIPAADASTLQWWDLQDDPHTSVRLLIHDEIERSGYTDRVNRIQSRPCTGHPPLTAEVVMQLMSIQELLQLGRAQQPAASSGRDPSRGSSGIGVDTDVSSENPDLVGTGRPYIEQPQQTRIANHAPAKVSQSQAEIAAKSAVDAPFEPAADAKDTEGKIYDLDDL